MLDGADIETVRQRVDLRALAVDLGAVFRGRARYGRCPICGGGPFAARFEILTDLRTWVCAVCCDGGDAIKLVMRVKGCGFREAVTSLGGPLMLSDAERAKMQAMTDKDNAERDAVRDAYRQKERRELYRVWRAAAPVVGTPVELYLRARGICRQLADLDLRCAERVYFHGDGIDERGRTVPREVFRGPVMLAAFVGADGRFAGLHQTWIDPARPGRKATIVNPDGGTLNAKKMRGHKLGGFIRLTRDIDLRRLVIGEGVETVLSIREALHEDFAYRAAGDLGNLAGKAMSGVPHPTLKTPLGRAQRVGGADPDFDSEATSAPPETCELVLVRDGDSDPYMTDLAMIRAARRHARSGLTIREMAPPPGLDFNDVLRGTAG